MDRSPKSILGTRVIPNHLGGPAPESPVPKVLSVNSSKLQYDALMQELRFQLLEPGKCRTRAKLYQFFFHLDVSELDQFKCDLITDEFRRLHQTVRRILINSVRVDVLPKFLQGLVVSHHFAESLAVARTILGGLHRDAALSLIAQGFANEDRILEAIPVLNEIKNVGISGQGTTLVVELLAMREDYRRALMFIDVLPEPIKTTIIQKAVSIAIHQRNFDEAGQCANRSTHLKKREEMLLAIGEADFDEGLSGCCRAICRLALFLFPTLK
jgi:hypothetical protein